MFDEVGNGPCTIQVIFPEGCTPIPPLISETDTLISLQDITQEVERVPSVRKKEKKVKLPFSECWTPGGYECPKCEKLYNARKNLARHINVECGKEPQFSCPYCGYKNHRRNEINKHVRNKHTVVVFN